MQEHRTRRDEILYFIIQYASERSGPTPTIREISHEFSLSYSTVYRHVQMLIQEDRLVMKDGKLLVPGAKWISPDDISQ